MKMRAEIAKRNLYFFWVFVSIVAFWSPVKQLVEFASSRYYGSHILLIAPVSIFLVYLRRQEIFSANVDSDRRSTIVAGLSLFFLGLIFLLVSKSLTANRLSLEILSLVTLWISVFVFCYGRESSIKARLPLLFLLLMVPFPEFVIDRVIFALQVGSSDIAYGLLRILNVPVLKEGFILRLPMVDLEVAKECSGIRSSIALLLTVLLAGQFVLRSGWRKLIFVLSIFPILVIKNGVRIVTIYLLTAYVNPAFLHGWLHTSGGIVFYVLGLAALVPIALLLRRGDSVPLGVSPMYMAQVTSG